MRTRPGPITYNPPGAPGVGPSASIDPGITSLAELAAVTTTNLIAPTIRVWIMAADGTSQTWQLLQSTAANDPTNGIVRPNDFDAEANAKVWFKSST
jgi:hypothetical protein